MSQQGMMPQQGMMSQQGMMPQQGMMSMQQAMSMGKFQPNQFNIDNNNAVKQFLAVTDVVVVKQKFDWKEAAQELALNAIGLDGGEYANKYNIFGQPGNQYVQGAGMYNTGFEVHEKSDNCDRCLCDPNHTIKMQAMTANPPTTVEIMERPGCIGDKPCIGCCSWTEDCQNTVNVRNNYKIQEECACGCTPNFVVTDEQSQSVATFQGPECCWGGFCQQIGEECGALTEIDIKDPSSGVVIATIIKTKRDTALQQAATALISDADSFRIEFKNPVKDSKDIELRYALFSALFMIDFIFFENDGNINAKVGETPEIVCFYYYCCGCIGRCKVGGEKNNE